jgi:carboxyl-terminal processing protease
MFAIKKRKLAGLLILFFLLGVLAGGGGFLLFENSQGGSVRIPVSEYSALQTIGKEYQDIEKLKAKVMELSLFPVTEDQLMTGMKRGLLSGVGDPYTNYLTKEDYESLMIMTTGQLQGIGVTVTSNNNFVEIVSTVKESPAHKAGLKSGDLIIKVDGTEYDGSQLQEAAAALRGETGTKVLVTFLRDEKVREIEIIRAEIELESVTSKMLDDQIGYIDIKSFESNTGSDFEKELRGLEMKGAKGLIIDLRDNGGGIVESGVEIADLLLDEGIIAYTEDYKKDRTYYKSVHGKTKLPYVILVNQGTASTSEILVAGVKYHKGGPVVGEKTYGKGVIQTVLGVTPKDYMRITIMEYFSPDGNAIHKQGIQPDYTVELTEGDMKDYQLDKALELLK